MHHCIHGSAYDARVWRAELPVAERAVLEAAGRVGAVVVFPESLYSYGPVDGPITEDTPRTATTGKLGVRTELLAQREASATPDGQRRGVRLLRPARPQRPRRRADGADGPRRTDDARARQPRPAALVHLRPRPRRSDDHRRGAARSCGTRSCTPPPRRAVTQRRLVELVAEAGGVPAPRTSAIPPWVLRASGVVSREMRELAETSYMFTEPFVLDSTASEQRLGLRPTAARRRPRRHRRVVARGRSSASTRRPPCTRPPDRRTDG